jgi:hypothetical protein
VETSSRGPCSHWWWLIGESTATINDQQWIISIIVV